MVTKVEWEAIKARANYKCLICGGKEGVAFPTLEKAHLKAESKGGTQIIPLCPNCHSKYDSGKCTATELKKIGVKPEHYKKVQPKKPSQSKSFKSQSGLDSIFGMSSSKSKKSNSGFGSLFDITPSKSSSKSKSKQSKNDFDSLFGFR